MEVHQKLKEGDWCSKASRRIGLDLPQPSFRKGFGSTWRKKNKGNKSVETRKIKMNFERKLNVEAQRTEAEEVGSGDDE